MYSKELRGEDTILILDSPVIVGHDETGITEFNLNEINEFEEEIYYKAQYIRLIGGTSVNFHATSNNADMRIKVSYLNDEIQLIISYELPNREKVNKKYILNEEQFITQVVDEMLLNNNKYIYNLPMIRDIAQSIKDEMFGAFIENDCLIVDRQAVNYAISCISREDNKHIAVANRFMYNPEDDSIILCETIDSVDLMENDEYIDLQIITNGRIVTIERASLASRSKGKIKYVCLVTKNSTITIEDTSDESIVFVNDNLVLPTIEDYLNKKSTDDLANILYDNNNQDKINQFYKNNNFIDVVVININSYLL